MTADEIRQQRANFEGAIAKLTQARIGAMTALADLEPLLADATADLGRAGLAARLGDGKTADVSRLQARVGELERERATHLAVSQEAQKQIAVLDAELVLVVQAERQERYRQAIAQRDRVVQIVAVAVDELAQQLAELKALEREAYAAGQDAGSPHSGEWFYRFAEQMSHRLGLKTVQGSARVALADFAKTEG